MAKKRTSRTADGGSRGTTTTTTTRAEVVEAIADHPGITEGDLVDKVGKSKGTVRNVLASLRDKGFVRVKRAKTPGRGPGPLEYTLNLRGRRTPASIVEELERDVGRVGRRKSAKSVYVYVVKGTNEAALTKDGRILRVQASKVDDHLATARKQLGDDAEPMSLAEFLRTYYPEGKVEGGL